jgi:peroxiredoxin Q/BCP
MKAFQRDISDFAKLDAQVLGVSADTLETHHDFAEELNLSFPLLADDGSISADYGNGRVTYLIDRKAVIRMICEGMPDNAALAAEIGKL